jgi:hypothetical protein
MTPEQVHEELLELKAELREDKRKAVEQQLRRTYAMASHTVVGLWCLLIGVAIGSCNFHK